jgi:hypothetical protein
MATKGDGGRKPTRSRPDLFAFRCQHRGVKRDAARREGASAWISSASISGPAPSFVAGRGERRCVPSRAPPSPVSRPWVRGRALARNAFTSAGDVGGSMTSAATARFVAAAAVAAGRAASGATASASRGSAARTATAPPARMACATSSATATTGHHAWGQASTAGSTTSVAAVGAITCTASQVASASRAAPGPTARARSA